MCRESTLKSGFTFAIISFLSAFAYIIERKGYKAMFGVIACTRRVWDINHGMHCQAFTLLVILLFSFSEYIQFVSSFLFLIT